MALIDLHGFNYDMYGSGWTFDTDNNQAIGQVVYGEGRDQYLLNRCAKFGYFPNGGIGPSVAKGYYSMRRITCGFAYKCGVNGYPPQDRGIIRLESPSIGQFGPYAQMQLYQRGAKIVLYQGGSFGDGGTQIAISTDILSPNTWQYIEIRTYIVYDSTGTVEIWVDSTKVIDFHGVTALGSLALYIDTIRLGCWANDGGDDPNSVSWYDDYYLIDDDLPGMTGPQGDITVVTSQVIQDATIQWDTDGLDLPSPHYYKIGIMPFESDNRGTFYIKTTTTNLYDTFFISPFYLSSGTVKAVEQFGQMQSLNNLGTFSFATKQGGTYYQSSAYPTSRDGNGAIQFYKKFWETNPAGGSWTLSDAESGEYGFRAEDVTGTELRAYNLIVQAMVSNAVPYQTIIVDKATVEILVQRYPGRNISKLGAEIMYIPSLSPVYGTIID